MRHKQRGAYSFLFLVILIGGGLLVFALAADGARLYAQQRVLQQQADLIALRAAREAQACGGVGVSYEQAREAALEAGVKGGYVGDLSLEEFQMGVIESVEGNFHFVQVSDIRRSNAFLVRLSQEVPRSFLLPKRLVGSTVISAQAAAKNELIAAVSSLGSTAIIGSTPGRASFLGEVLGGLLLEPGQRYMLTPTDLDSLATTLVSVGQLVQQTGAADLVEFLGFDARRLTVALASLSDGLEPAGEIAAGIDSVLASGGVNTLKVADVINVIGEVNLPEDAQFPLYDLLIALVLNTVEGSVFNFPVTDVDIELPGIAKASGTVTLAVNSAPSIVVGPAMQGSDGKWMTAVQASDIDLGLQLTVRLGSILGLTLADIQIPLMVQTGLAEADLTGAVCASGFSNKVSFFLDASSATARLRTARMDPLTGEPMPAAIDTTVARVHVPLVGSVDVLSLKLNVNASVEGRPSDVPMKFEVDLVEQRNGQENLKFGYGVPKYVGDGADALVTKLQVEIGLLVGTGLLETILSLLGQGLTVILGGVTSLLDGVVSSILESVIAPLLEALGVNLGEAAFAIVDAHQDAPVLLRGVEVVAD